MKNQTRKAVRSDLTIINPYDYHKANRLSAGRSYYRNKEKRNLNEIVEMKERLTCFLNPYVRIACIKVLSHTVQLQIHDHETEPRLQLYVLIEVGGEQFHCHTRKKEFIEAINELSCWIEAVVVGEKML